MNSENTQITSGTIVRTIVLVVALVNQILTSTGHSIIPISDEQIDSIVSILFTVIASIVAWWKNNSFTAAAIEADKTMKELKSSSEANG
jgi:SPP1 family holin